MLVNLGPEPLTKNFNANYLFDKLRKKTMNIKTTMMDNKIVVGVGNIYINEALFNSRINPEIKANEISLENLEILVSNIKKILANAIDQGGSSIKNYVNSKGDLGNYQSNFNIYGKEGENCVICDSKIKRLVQNGRSTFFCPQCQKL
jgi:formamidopyrimidine-DNA glycosylase